MSRPPLWRPAGLRLKPLYQPADLDGMTHLHGLPGSPPFVRGPYASMYTAKPWTLRQYTGFAGAQACNERLRQNLAEGGQGLSLAFDLPTHRGYDSSDPLAAADVGKAGVAIDDVEDMRELLAGIDLSKVSVSMTMNGAVLPVLACFIVAAEESGVAPDQLRGTVQNDILKEFMVRNTYIFAPVESMRICVDVIEFLGQHVPGFNPISVSGYHFQEAGADIIWELALALANARTYAEHVKARGLDLNDFCARISFFFAVGSDFFSEVAKLRAARLLWHEIATQLGASALKSQALRMHCQTSGCSLRAQAPLDNVVRTTVQAMAAVFGGTQSLHTNAWDEALALPGEDAARLARNTQKILQDETGMCDVIDPWAGSYMMEHLTLQIAEQVRLRIADIDARGGVLRGIETGEISRQIHAQATAAQARLDQAATCDASPDVDTEASVDSNALRMRQVERLRGQRLARDNRRVHALLESLTASARSGVGNLLHLTIEAVRARASVGECTRALELAWPRHSQTMDFVRGQYTMLRAGDRDWADALQTLAAWRQHNRRAPVIVLGKLGQDGHDRGIRMIASVLADAGFVVHLLPLFQSPAHCATALAEHPVVDLLGISSLAGAHIEAMGELLPCLRATGFCAPVVLGGIIPPADRARLLAGGVAACFGPGQPMPAIILALVGCLAQSPAHHPIYHPGLAPRGSAWEVL